MSTAIEEKERFDMEASELLASLSEWLATDQPKSITNLTYDAKTQQFSCDFVHGEGIDNGFGPNVQECLTVGAQRVGALTTA